MPQKKSSYRIGLFGYACKELEISTMKSKTLDVKRHNTYGTPVLVKSPPAYICNSYSAVNESRSSH